MLPILVSWLGFHTSLAAQRADALQPQWGFPVASWSLGHQNTFDLVLFVSFEQLFCELRKSLSYLLWHEDGRAPTELSREPRWRPGQAGNGGCSSHSLSVTPSFNNML